MTEIPRPSPKHKPVSLFVTCIVDMVYPNTGVSVVKILDRLGIEVRFPQEQTCCAQPAFNAGFWDDSRTVARQFLATFKDAEVIVAPSGSCSSMVRHFYPQLFKDDPELRDVANHVASITWEFSEYLVDGLGITDLGAALPASQTVSFHDACHGLRMMGLRNQARQLVSAVAGAEIVELQGANECCGFGGLFAVKMPEVSGAMLRHKVDAIQSNSANVILTGDCSCMTQMNGGLSRAGAGQRVQHLADFLAEHLPEA